MRFQLRRSHHDDQEPAPKHEPAPQPPPTPISNGRNGLPPRMTLRGQAGATDARAERMVRRVRQEIDELRETLDLIGAGQDEMLEVTPAAVAENPSVAETLAPRILVRSLIRAASTEEELRGRLATRDAEIAALRHQLAKLREEQAHDSGRLATFEQVLAALHANLEDLRSERTYLQRDRVSPQERLTGEERHE